MEVGHHSNNRLSPVENEKAVMSSGHSSQRHVQPHWLVVTFSILFLLSVVAIYPFGHTRSEIWVMPKQSVQALLLIPLFLLAHVSSGHRRVAKRGSVLVTGLGAIIYLLAICIGLARADDVGTALFGFPEYPEGAIFFTLLLFVFTGAALVSNSAPQFLTHVAILVIGASVLVSLAAVPQKLNWLLDYTSNSGVVSPWDDRFTFAGIYRYQMPISMAWHRGHMGYIAALGLATSIGIYNARLTGTRSHMFLGAAIALCTMGLVISDTRAALLAGGTASLFGIAQSLVPRIGRIRRTGLLGGSLVSGLALGLALSLAGDSRSNSLASILLGRSAGLEKVAALSSRDFLWSVALQAQASNVWLGSGYLEFLNDLGEAQLEHAIRSGEVNPSLIVSTDMNQYSTSAVLSNGAVWNKQLIGSKPHNSILEHLHATGVIGLGGLVLGLSTVFATILRDRRTRWILLPGIAWFIFSMFWYESIQFSVLHWMLFGAGMGVAITPMEHGGV